MADVVGLADSSVWEWARAVTSMGDTCNGTGVGIVTRGGMVDVVSLEL